jgi:hypothetical protein
MKCRLAGETEVFISNNSRLSSLWVPDQLSKAMIYGLDGGFQSNQSKTLLLFTASRLTLSPKQPPLKWALGYKVAGASTDHSHRTFAEVKLCGAATPLCTFINLFDILQEPIGI